MFIIAIAVMLLLSVLMLYEMSDGGRTKQRDHGRPRP